MEELSKRPLVEIKEEDLDLIKGGLKPRLKALQRENRLSMDNVRELLFEEINFGFSVSREEFSRIYGAVFWQRFEESILKLVPTGFLDSEEFLGKHLPHALMQPLSDYLAASTKPTLPPPAAQEVVPAVTAVRSQLRHSSVIVHSAGEIDKTWFGDAINRASMSVEEGKLADDRRALEGILERIHDPRRKGPISMNVFLNYDYSAPERYASQLKLFAENVQLWRECNSYRLKWMN